MMQNFIHWTLKNCVYLNTVIVTSTTSQQLLFVLVLQTKLTFHQSLFLLSFFPSETSSIPPKSSTTGCASFISRVTDHRGARATFTRAIQTHIAAISAISLPDTSRKHLIASACQIRAVASYLSKRRDRGIVYTTNKHNILSIYQSIFYVWCNPYLLTGLWFGFWSDKVLQDRIIIFQGKAELASHSNLTPCQVLYPPLIASKNMWGRSHQASNRWSLDCIYSAFLRGRCSRLLFGPEMRWNRASINTNVPRWHAVVIRVL